MKVLITGGNGDIAQAIAQLLREKEHSVLTPSHEVLNVTNDFEVRTYMIRNKPDVIINNAGIINPQNIVIAGDSGTNMADDICWEDQILVNLVGTYLCSKYGLISGAKQIINIGSSAGAKGKAGWSAYCAAKAGVERLTESLHAEGHYATCLRIGRTKTSMRRELFGEEDPDTLMHPMDVAVWVPEIMDNPKLYSGCILDINKLSNEIWVGTDTCIPTTGNTKC